MKAARTPRVRRPPPASRRTAPVRRRPRTAHGQDSRQAILAAATVEFAARGYDGASVDRIAARARLNKAMIYYHFRSKRGLYAAILHEWFDYLFTRVRAIAAEGHEPDRQVDAFIEAVVREGETRPALPRMMAREIADGGRHLDPETVRTMARIAHTVAGFIEHGKRLGRFIDVDAFLVYLILLGPMVFFLVSRPVRDTLGRLRMVDPAGLRTERFIHHLQLIVRRGLDSARPSTPRLGDRP